MATYLPSSDGSMLAWLANFKLKIATHGPTVGLAALEVTDLQAACDALTGFIQAVEAAKTNLAQAVAAKEESKGEDLKLIRDQIARLKTHNMFTETIGQALGVISSPSNPDFETMKTELTATAYAGYVRIKFKKKAFSGVKIFTRLKGTVGWTFLALDTESPYDDHRPLTVPNQPEEREYMGLGMDGDEQVGLESDIVSVVFGG